MWDPSEIIKDKNEFLMPALQIQFMVNDCMPLAMNGIIRCALFKDREQAHLLAMLRQKKNDDSIKDRKVDEGYSLELFNHFVIKNGMIFYFVILDTLVKDKDKGAWEYLRDFVN